MEKKNTRLKVVLKVEEEPRKPYHGLKQIPRTTDSSRDLSENNGATRHPRKRTKRRRELEEGKTATIATHSDDGCGLAPQIEDRRVMSMTGDQKRGSKSTISMFRL